MGQSHLTEAQRTRVRILQHDSYLTRAQIHTITGFGLGQIRRALREPIPKPRSGRPTLLTKEQEQELIEFVTASRKNRRMTFLSLSTNLFDGRFGQYCIRSALRRNGYHRYVAYNKPIISEVNRQRRLKFALDHQNWTSEQWDQILWTDETWVTYGRNRKTYITRRQGEELDDTCVVDRIRKKAGWMFWGSFSGYGKGIGIFWEKDWGHINSVSYCEHVVPLIHGWIQHSAHQGQHLILMQDGAPAHAAATTLLDLQEREVIQVKWPPYSPDLNPIENCWNWLKAYLEDKYGDEPKPSYALLRQWVQEAWEALPKSYWRAQLLSMPERMAAVIEANGLHTKY
jgi:transposase